MSCDLWLFRISKLEGSIEMRRIYKWLQSILILGISWLIDTRYGYCFFRQWYADFNFWPRSWVMHYPLFDFLFSLSMQSYASILYLRLPPGFRIILRGKDVEHHNIVNDMMHSEMVKYRPQPGADGVPKDITVIRWEKVLIGFFVSWHAALFLISWYCCY